MKRQKTLAEAETRQTQTSREAILAAALKAFARHGFDGASMPKIAEMAQVAPPLIHYYYGSKENLWKATVGHALGDLKREAISIANATRGLSPLDRLRVLLQLLSRHAAHLPDHFVMLMAESRSESDRYMWAQNNYTGPILDEVLKLLQNAEDQGLIEDVRIDQLGFMLIGGMLLYFAVNPNIVNKQNDLDKLAAEYTDMIYGVLVNGAGKHGR